MPNELLELENAVVAGFLYSKIIEAESNHINIELDIRSVKLSEVIMDSQWVEVLGILLDNAIEASNTEDYVYLSMEYEASNMITVKNHHKHLKKDAIDKCFEKGFSTKAKNRGIGLYNLKKTVQGCNGRIEAFNEVIEDLNYVVFRVIIPS
jgi:sensor histidine kinase regulating citrate/malate metabolism